MATTTTTSTEVIFTERKMHACGHVVPVNARGEECKETSGKQRKQRTRVRFFFVSSPCDVCLGKPTKAPASLEQLKSPVGKTTVKAPVKIASLDPERQEKHEKKMEKVRLAKKKAQLIREMLKKHAAGKAADESADDGSAEVWSDEIPGLQELMSMATA